MCLCVCLLWLMSGEEPGWVLFRHAACSDVPKNWALIIIWTQLSLCSVPLLWVCGVQTRRAKMPSELAHNLWLSGFVEGIGSVRFLLVTARQNRKAGPFSLSVNVCVCLCVCVSERERERESVSEREKERESCVQCVFMCASVFTAA